MEESGVKWCTPDSLFCANKCIFVFIIESLYNADSKIQLEGEGAVQIINNIPRSDNSVGKS